MALASSYFSLPYIQNLGVHNVSSKQLSPHESFVLGLGLKYCISAQALSNDSIRSSYNQFARSIRIRWKFRQQQNSYSRFKLPNPTYKPSPAHIQIENYLECVSDKLDAALTNTPVEACGSSRSAARIRKIVTSLKNDTSIIIKPADKNLGTVVVDRSWYEGEALRQLCDTKVYTKVQTIPTHLYAPAVRALDKYGDWVDHDVRNFILEHHTAKDAHAAKFYLLPKVHKENEPLKGRPICSSIGTATHNASIWLDAQLQPLMHNISSYIKDSRAVCIKLSTLVVPGDCVLASLDVASLYPSISITEGLLALKEFLSDFHRDSNIHQLILALAEWVLRSNYITFGDTLWRQIQGTAMGTPFAVVFANIFLGQLERKAIARLPLHQRPLFYVRFIDDLLGVFDSANSVNEFKTSFDSISPSISTTVTSGSSVPFLDLQISKSSTTTTSATTEIQLVVNLHQKEMNKYLFVPPPSFHPPAIFGAFINAELQRFRFICSENTDYVTAVNNFCTRLQARGYNTTLYQDLVDNNPSRETLFDRYSRKSNTPTTSKAPIIFKIEYNNRLLKLGLRDILSLPEDPIVMSPDIKQFFSNRRPLQCFQRAPNLGQLLTTSAHSYSINTQLLMQQTPQPTT